MNCTTRLIGWHARPFPAHLRENRDLCAGSTGTKCLQIKIVFPSALLACFMLALHQAGFQTCDNISPVFRHPGAYYLCCKFTRRLFALYSSCFPCQVKLLLHRISRSVVECTE